MRIFALIALLPCVVAFSPYPTTHHATQPSATPTQDPVPGDADWVEPADESANTQKVVQIESSPSPEDEEKERRCDEAAANGIEEAGCGIAGGEPAPPLFGHLPMPLVALSLSKSQNAHSREWGGTCTGTLIEPDIVLTAAHCVTDQATGKIINKIVGHADIGDTNVGNQWRGDKWAFNDDTICTDRIVFAGPKNKAQNPSGRRGLVEGSDNPYDFTIVVDPDFCGYPGMKQFNNYVLNLPYQEDTECRASCEGRENCVCPSDYCKREGGYGTHDIALIKLARPYKCAHTLPNTLSKVMSDENGQKMTKLSQAARDSPGCENWVCPDAYAPDVPGGPCKTQCQAVANFLPGYGPPEYESTEGLLDAWMHRGCDCTCHTGPPWVAAPPWLAGGLGNERCMIRLEVEPYDQTAYTYENQAPCCADADYDASSNPYPPSRLGMKLTGTGFRQKRDISRVNEKNFRNLEITPCGATSCEILEDVGGIVDWVRYPPCQGCKRYDGAKKAIYGANVLARKRDALDSVSVLRDDRGDIVDEGYDLWAAGWGLQEGKANPANMDMWSSRGVLQTIRLEELCCKHKPRLSRRKGRAACRNGDYVKGLKDRGFVCSRPLRSGIVASEEDGADLCLMGVGKTCIRGGAKGTIYVRATYDSDSARTLNEVLIEKQFSGKSQKEYVSYSGTQQGDSGGPLIALPVQCTPPGSDSVARFGFLCKYGQPVIIGTVSHGLNLRENNHEDPVTGQPVDGAVSRITGYSNIQLAMDGWMKAYLPEGEGDRMDITTELEQGVNGEDFVPSILSKDDNVCAVLQDDGVINEASPLAFTQGPNFCIAPGEGV